MPDCKILLQCGEPRQPKENILIVEDDPDLGEALLVALSDAGYGGRVVSTRDEALKAIQCNLYQIVLLDFKMPGLPANAFIEEVSRRPMAPKIILMTGTNADLSAKLIGIKYWLKKPFSPERLLLLLNHELTPQPLNREAIRHLMEPRQEIYTRDDTAAERRLNDQIRDASNRDPNHKEAG